MNLPRQHHYVWGHYLEAWEIDGQLQVSRNRGDVFSSSAAKIARQRDFYRLPMLQPQDVGFIKDNISIMGLTPEGKDVAYGWLKPWERITQIEKWFDQRPMPAKVRTALDEYATKAEEMIHNSMETNAVSVLDALRHGDCRFWSDGKEVARSFSFFLAVQHLRTKKMVDQLTNNLAPLFDREMIKRS